MSKIAILILAAGKSSRMGTIKQLLKVNNKTLIENAIINAQQAKATSVYCVLGAYADTINESLFKVSINTIFNPDYKDGLGTSIATGTQYINKESKSFDAILMMLADQPQIDTQYLNHLIHLHSNNPQHIIASNYKNKAGVPAIFPKKYFSTLSELNGDQGAKTLLTKNSTDLVMATIKPNLKDIDTPKDYISYLKSN